MRWALPAGPWREGLDALDRADLVVITRKRATSEAALGLYARKNVICLDSGCVWGGTLTALRLEDRQLFQVPGKKRRGRR